MENDKEFIEHEDLENDRLSVESMCLSSGTISPEVLDITTNSSFLHPLPNAQDIVTEVTDFNSTHCSMEQESNMLRSSEAENTLDSESVAVADLSFKLFPTVDSKHFPSWMETLAPLLAQFWRNTPRATFDCMVSRLKRHLFLTEDGKLSINLVAAAILGLHPMTEERRYSHDDIQAPKTLPCILRERLSCGLFVPMVHILYGEALMNGHGYHVNACGQKVGAEPYPISLQDSPPKEFCTLVKRIDIIRGMTSHGLALAFRFPYLASKMHGLLHFMWTFLFTKRMPVAAGMELYDAFFQEFEKQLCLLQVMPIDKFPSRLIKCVYAKYPKKTSLQHLTCILH